MVKIIAAVFVAIILVVLLQTFLTPKNPEESTRVESQSEVETVPVRADIQNTEIEVSETPKEDTQTNEVSAPILYTLADIAVHNDMDSCWTVIGDAVYDITPWIEKHPGGERAILKICGRDGTSVFESKHGGDAKPEAILLSYKVGNFLP